MDGCEGGEYEANGGWSGCVDECGACGDCVEDDDWEEDGGGCICGGNEAGE